MGSEMCIRDRKKTTEIINEKKRNLVHTKTNSLLYLLRSYRAPGISEWASNRSHARVLSVHGITNTATSIVRSTWATLFCASTISSFFPPPRLRLTRRGKRCCLVRRAEKVPLAPAEREQLPPPTQHFSSPACGRGNKKTIIRASTTLSRSPRLPS